MHIRIQGWIPYEVQIYINGREWLARRLDKAGIGYVRYDNSLLRVDDLEGGRRAVRTLRAQAWPRVLNAFARMVNPHLARSACSPAMAATTGCSIRPRSPPTSCSTPAGTCSTIWPDLVHHAALNMGSEDVLGFLGRKLHPVPGGRGGAPTPNAAPKGGGSVIAWAPTG